MVFPVANGTQRRVILIFSKDGLIAPSDPDIKNSGSHRS